MAVTWCANGVATRENGELTSCFVDTLLLLPSVFVLFVLLPALCILLRGKTKLFNQTCVRFKYHTARWIVTLLLFLCLLTKVGEAFIIQSKMSATALHMYLPNMLSFVCLLGGVIYYDLVEVDKKRPFKNLLLLYIYWLLNVIVWAIKFVQLYQIGGPYDMRLYTNLAILTFYIILMLLERNVLFGHIPSRLRFQAKWSNVNKQPTCPDLQSDNIKFVHDFSNFISRITFSWMWGILSLGNNRPLEHEDIGDATTPEKVEAVHKNFSEVWEREQQRAAKNKTSSSLWRVCFLANRSDYINAGICRLFSELLSFIGPLSLKQIVLYVETILRSEDNQVVKPSSENDVYLSVSEFFSNGFVLAVVILMGNLTMSILFQYYVFIAYQLSFRIRAALQLMVYKKTLYMSSWSLSGGSMNSGKVVNHVSVDSQNISTSMLFIQNAWFGPMKLLIAVLLLVNELGIAALVGVAVLAMLLPINYYLAAKMGLYQKRGLSISDERLKNSNEMLQGIKLLKLYSWENWFCTLIEKIRKKEMVVKLRTALLNSIISFITVSTTTIVALVTFVSFVQISGENLTAAKAFSSLALFNLMKPALYMFPMLVRSIVNARVSMKRLIPFLISPEISKLREEAPVCQIDEDELLPAVEEFRMDPIKKDVSRTPGSPTIEVSEPDFTDAAPPIDFCIPDNIALVINNASFKWDPQAQLPTINNININIPKYKLTMVVGPVGSGKSSLVNALLGEMTSVDGQVVWSGDMTVAYAAQKPWLLNDTVRNNVLFGQEYIKERYEAILDACAMKSDLDILPAGDQTEIGEKGINLSGGQKQRISIARAIYSGANFIIFDDPLSALDAHVGQHVFEQAISKMLVKRGKTVMLVTHQLQYLPKADNVIVMKDGNAVICSSFHEVEESKSSNVKQALTLARQQSIEREHKVLDVDEEEQRERKPTMREEIEEAKKEEKKEEQGKLMSREEREKGAVSLRVYLTYLKACGYIGVAVTVFFAVVAQAGVVTADWWISVWSSDVPTANKTTKHDVDYYLTGYIALSLVAVLLTIVKSITIAVFCTRGAKVLHMRMLRRVIHAPMRFFDTTPIGRVLNRLSSDTTNIDSNLIGIVQNFITLTLSSIAAIIVQAIVTPYFLLVVLPFCVVYYYIQRFIRRSTRELQRLDSISKSPVYAGLSETLAGLTTIRAYCSQERFQTQITAAIDKNTTASRFTQMAHRWLALRLDIGGSLIVFLAAISSVAAALSGTISPGLVGLALAYALSVTQVFNWVVRMATELEMNMNAVERVAFYSNIENEPSNEEIIPDKDWPKIGQLAIKDLTLAYAHDLPPAITDVTINIRGGEKVGVCGRTGSGKSTITLGLFRMLEHFEGSIQIDGVDISKLSLHTLRSRLAIIPQDPILFQGSIRFNLDPQAQHTDDQLWRSLEVAQLKAPITAMQGGLDAVVSEGGENLSVGQRQLFCLARALLVKSKVLVMDEATANVDEETDKLIQKVVRSAFKDFTILIIAHRIHTILDCDRIIVLDKGKVIEWDAPQTLLKNEKSVFSSLVKAHDKQN